MGSWGNKDDSIQWGYLFERGVSTDNVVNGVEIGTAGVEKSEVKRAWVRAVLGQVSHGESRIDDLAFLEFTPEGKYHAPKFDYFDVCRQKHQAGH